MAVSFVNTQQPRIDAWIQPGCRADIAVVSTESWPVDTVVTIGVADAAGVIAVPLLTITPDLATLTATVALTGVQVAALAVACPPPYGVIDWQWRTGAGSPLGVGSLHWDLTGARTTQTVTVMMGPAGPGATPEAISALVEDYLVAHPPTGSGDVTGPASAVAGNLAALDATGKILSDSGSKPADFAPASHNHAGVYDPAGTAAGLVGGITPASIGAQPAGSYAPALGPDDNYLTDTEKAQLHTHPAVIAQGATQADARAAIGAGTSSFSGAYADLSSKPTLGDAAAKNTGTTAGTLAAGDDSRFASSGIPASIVDAKGDLIVATAADTVSRLAVGATTGHVLTVNPAAATGVEWAPGAAGAGGIGVGAFTFGYAGGNDQTLLAGNYLRSGTGTITIPTTVGHLFPMPMAHSVTVDGFRLKLATAGDGSCQLQVALYAITAAGVLGARLSPVWTVGATTTGEKYTTALTPFSVPAGMSVIVVTSSGQVSTDPQLASSGNPSPLAWSWANGEGAAGRWAACSSVTSLPDPWTAGAATSIGSSETPVLGLFF